MTGSLRARRPPGANGTRPRPKHGNLEAVATARLQKIADLLARETEPLISGARYFVDREEDGGSRAHCFRAQIIETARELGYFANLSEYRAWTRLVLRAGSQAEFLLSFHRAGAEFRGLIAVSACFFRRDETEAGERQVTAVTPLSADIFQVNYLEGQADVEARFRDWLESMLVTGLNVWRAGL